MLSVLTLAESLLFWLNKVISQGRVNIFAMFKKGCYYASSDGDGVQDASNVVNINKRVCMLRWLLSTADSLHSVTPGSSGL